MHAKHWIDRLFRRGLQAGAVLLVAAAVWTLAADAAERAAGPATPKAVEDGVRKAFPQARILKVDRETPEIVIYEVKFRQGEQSMEAEVSADGQILVVEQDAAQKDLPAAVRATLAKEIGQAHTEELVRREIRAELVVQRLAKPKIVYEAEFEKGGRDMEIQIDAQGQVVKRKADIEDDDHGKADEHEE